MPDGGLSLIIASTIAAAATAGSSAYAAHAQGSLSHSLQREQFNFNREEAEKARQFNHDEAELSRQFTLDADNTKYQRQVRDMRAAGINPLLSALMNPSAPNLGMMGQASAASASQGQLPDTSGYERAGSAIGNMIKEIATEALKGQKSENEKKEVEVEVEKATKKNIESQTYRNYADAFTRVAGPAATAYGGYKVGSALKNVAPLVKNGTVNIPMKSIRNPASLGLFSPYGVGALGSAYLGGKIIDYNQKINEKFKHDKDFLKQFNRGPNPLFLFH